MIVLILSSIPDCLLFALDRNLTSTVHEGQFVAIVKRPIDYSLAVLLLDLRITPDLTHSQKTHR